VNLRLAAFLAWRSLVHHRTVAFATVLGVVIGMTVVGAILIVDHNSVDTAIRGEVAVANIGLGVGGRDGMPPGGRSQRVLRVTFERGGEPARPWRSFPTQEGKAGSGIRTEAPPLRRGEEDYQAMRLAVRLASLMAFGVAAVIVFYTMRFSVASRGREFSLLLCLGEERRNVALSLLVQAAVLGLAGTLVGLLLAFPVAAGLVDAGISTTGRIPSRSFAVPWEELAGMGMLSLCVALVAVADPVRTLYRMNVVDVLQPRFAAPAIDEHNLNPTGFGWLWPPLMAAAWLVLRPFLQDWLSVVQLFVLESLFTAGLALAVLWWVHPVLRSVILLAERLLRPFMPLETLLVGRRLRLTSRRLVFTLAGVTLVFSLITALHDITSALKHEIGRWAEEALTPYVFLKRNHLGDADDDAIRLALEKREMRLFRLSGKVKGELPFRLVRSDDVNPYLADRGRPLLGPGRVLVSRTLAARFDLAPGDRMVIHTAGGEHRFQITEVTDDLGFFADEGQYVDLKSWFLFSEGNPIFSGYLERSLGDYGVVSKRNGGIPETDDLDALRPHYRVVGVGWQMGDWQQDEIDRDFLIFDFILVMTVVLAAVGVANAILIQVHARERELSVLRMVGVSRGQTTRLLLVEGAVIGIASALLALVLGHALGAISVAFLDRFTLFDYRFVFSPGAGALISSLAVATCCLSAIYPSIVANRTSSAESLHYE